MFTSKLSLILHFRYSSCEYPINIPLMKESTKLYLHNIKSTVLQNSAQPSVSEIAYYSPFSILPFSDSNLDTILASYSPST